MRPGWGTPSLALLLLLLALWTPLGDGNEGSSAGSCHCDKTFYSKSPPTDLIMEHLRKQLKSYHRCTRFVRFQLPSRMVCGGSKDQWVIELVSCLDRKECGHAYYGRVVQQKHLPPPSTQVPEPTERAPSDMGTPAQTYLPPTLLQSTQQPTLPAGAPSLDKKLTHANETTTSSVSRSLEAGPETGENQQQLEENVGPKAQTPAMVPVLSLLGIIFILTGILFYVLCKRRKQSLQYSPDLQLHYTLVVPDSNA